MLLRCCDTTSTHLRLKIPDFCGVFSRQLALETAHNSSGLIYVNELFITTEYYDIFNTVRCKSYVHGAIAECAGIKESWYEELFVKPKRQPSSLPLWQFCHESDINSCHLAATEHKDEPKWTADKLVDLIKAWQNGRIIDWLLFRYYECEREETEVDFDFFDKTLEGVQSSFGSRLIIESQITGCEVEADGNFAIVSACLIMTDSNATSTTSLKVVMHFRLRELENDDWARARYGHDRDAPITLGSWPVDGHLYKLHCVSFWNVGN